MRDLGRVDAKGNGLSKCYGFVNFETHTHAMEALKLFNNCELYGKKRVGKNHRKYNSLY